MDIEALYALLWDFSGQRVVTVAARTGMLRFLAEKAATADALAGALGLDPLATGKMVRALSALGLVEFDGDRYRLGDDLRRYFLPGEDDLTPFVEHAHGLYDRWGAGLEEWVRTGVHLRGKRSAAQLERFGRAMWASARLMAKQVVRALDGFEGIGKVLDVGGGIGGYAAVFCQAKMDLRVTVLDIPEMARLGRESIAGTELARRISFRSGDYHETDFGADYDLVLLANVLHIEKVEQAAELIRRAAEALVPGGHLCVVDFVIDDQKRRDALGALFAINMRSFGDTHSESQIRAWMDAAGIAGVRRVDLPPAHWLITGRHA